MAIPGMSTAYPLPSSATCGAGRNSIATFATLSAALIAGTGGCFVPSSMPLYAAMTAKPIILVVGREESSLPATRITTTQLVLNVRESFGLNFSQLAKVFGVARQTVYDWLQGAEPREQVLRRLWELDKLSSRVRALPIARRSSLLTRSILDGRTLLTLLEQNQDVEKGVFELERQFAQSSQVLERTPRSPRAAKRSVDQLSRVITDWKD